ncbi:MAG TPA: S8 family peptidase [Vicinamibacterales bacterium]|nr:S8 family peptidase [Vicinamibacterales bacterium]
MLTRSLLLLALLAGALPAQAGQNPDGKLDASLRARAHHGGTSRVIIETADVNGTDVLIRSVKGKPGRRLGLVRGQVAEVPNAALESLARHARVSAIRLDRPVRGTMERTSATVGAKWVRENLDLDGSGVGVAIIDSGVTTWHDDLGSDRVVHFADFVDFQPTAYDDYGHGTHVAGIIAGNGYDSNGARRGIAPGANLVVLKVLDGEGFGYISNVIAALDYVVQRRAQFNIRVINLSVAAGVYESYATDPLTLAAKRAVEAGVVVVTAAGNLGRNAQGQAQYGGITAPGNAPWVLTVGASSHNGTISRTDDSMASFSSRGPSSIDYTAKPDLAAPGVGIESLADASSLLFATHPGARLWGTVDTATQPYLSLTGTSMAAPVVAGTVALMFQANPSLTPNLVKAILQYTAEHKSRYNDLTQGAGFLNARGAVQVAKMFAASGNPSPARASDPTPWNKHINWGTHRIGGGVLRPDANAWRLDVTWGAATTGEGDAIVWGTVCTESDACGTIKGSLPDEDNIVWGTSSAEEDNIVWGTTCGGNDCSDTVWGSGCDESQSVCANIVRGASTDEDNIVWGTSTADEDNIVWGTVPEVADARGGKWSLDAPRALPYPIRTNRTLSAQLSPSTPQGS